VPPRRVGERPYRRAVVPTDVVFGVISPRQRAINPAGVGAQWSVFDATCPQAARQTIKPHTLPAWGQTCCMFYIRSMVARTTQ